MKEYRLYMCDFGHQWTLFRDEADPEQDDYICPFGHEAITLTKLSTVNDVQVTFRPAGRIENQRTGEVSLRGRYYIVISNIAGMQERVSDKIYSWEEACQLASNFDKRSFEWALDFWGRKSP